MSVVNTMPVGVKPTGYQQLTVSATALTLTVPNGTTRAVLTVEAHGIRYRFGAAPTGSVGMPVAVGVSFEVYGKDNIEALQVIKSGGSDATLNAVYYG